jgi:IgA Peptidase M64
MNLFRYLILLVVVLLCARLNANAQSVTKIVDHGPDGEKLTFVVLGDGYNSTEQGKFSDDVNRLVVNGVFGHDFYKDNFAAFNVHRIDLVSRDSGVSTLAEQKDTALKVIYNGEWSRCWLEESPETDQRIVDATVGVKKADFILVVANEGGYGGCQRGGRLYITAGDDWDVVAHEYGHGIAGLYDEYSVSGTYTTPPINIKNCSTIANRTGVSWGKLIATATPVPSDDSTTLDPNQSVGIFTGCNYALAGIYRPVRNCRMKSNTPNFCPVCLGLMNRAVKPYLPPQVGTRAKVAGKASAGQVAISSETYVNLVIRLSQIGEPQILRANQLTGRVIPTSNSIPSYIFVFSRKEKPSFVQYLADSPFVVRGFVDPKHPEKGESLSQSQTTTVIVNVPNTDMSSAIHELGFQVFTVNPAAAGIFTKSSSADAGSLLKMLQKSNALTMEASLPTAKLGDAVRSVQ